MAAAGEVVARCLDDAALQVPGRRHDGGAGQAAEKFIRSQGGEPAFKGYRGFPALDLRVAELDGGSRHPRALHARARGHPVDRRRRRARRLGRRRGDHGSVAAGQPGGDQAARATREALDAGARAVPPGRSPRGRLERRPGARRARRLLGDPLAGRATGSAATCTRILRSRTSASPGKGPLIEEGMVFCIEPMVCVGRPRGAHGRRQLGDLLRGRLADGPLRAHGRGHGRGAEDPHPLAPEGAEGRGLRPEWRRARLLPEPETSLC